MSRIYEHVKKIKVIDGHEHLATPQIRKKENQDFFWLLHYLESDLVTAGMPRGALGKQSNLDDIGKFEIFLKYWEGTKNTTYARILKVAFEDLYGFNDWSIEGLVELNRQIIKSSHNDAWYDEVLINKCNIDLVLDLIFTTNLQYDLYRPIMFVDFLYRLQKHDDISLVVNQSEKAVKTLEEYLSVVDKILDKYLSEGMVALKLGHAYWRNLDVSNPTFCEAETLFQRIAVENNEIVISLLEAKPLQDFIINHVITYSIKEGIPIQIHTGHLEPSVSGDGNCISNSNVEGLIPLFLKYENAKFVLLHGGFPYHGQYLSIIKNHPNTYADLSWVYIMSPTVAKQILHQMIEMIPMAKIQGFGGDYSHIEGTYAHLKLAKKIVSEVLQEKVDTNDLEEDEAIEFANRIFRNNLIDLYNLDIPKI